MHFKNFAKNTSTKEVFFTSIGIILAITILRSLGFLQSLELTAYDFLFYLRPDEPIDERIVIVGWDEEDIRTTQEGTISDNTLAITLDKIKAQEPRYIGLDIIRDLPESSYPLSKKQNQQAYERLIEIFQSTPNLIGVEKVLPPIVNPSKVLKKEEKTTAADLLEDVDGNIRRAYLFPKEDEEGNPAEIPAMGMILGIQYLLPEGFIPGQIESNNALTLSHPQNKTQVILNPLEKFDGAYIKEQDGLKILVNWRKGKPQFSRVFVRDVVTGNIPPDIFRDKLVLIGNIAVSSSDKHRLPIDHWQKSSISNGVEIQAQIASSIISAALDARPLIKTIPEWSEYLILLITVVGISLVARTYRQISPLHLYLITVISGVVVISFLVGSSLIAFTQGYWIPVVPSLLGSLITPIIVCLVIYIDKIKQSNEENKLLLKELQQANKEYKLLIKDFNHTIQNNLNSMMSNGKFARFISDALSQTENIPLLLAQLEEEFGQPPATLLKNSIDGLMLQLKELNRQRENAQEYLKVTYLEDNIFALQPISLNDFIQTTVKRTIPLKQSQYNLEIKLQENYDPQIPKVNIHPQSFEKVLENLIDNAYYAIKAKLQNIPEHQGIINIQTQQENNQIKIIVQDNGIGISPAIIERIFIPFQSFKAKNQGQGLGLSIAKETMAYLKGNIKVESTEGEGSEFILTLPQK